MDLFNLKSFFFDVKKATFFLSATVVNVECSLQEDGEVEKTEGDVANDFATNREDVEAAGLKNKGTSQGVHHRKRLGRDVGVPKLVQFDEDQNEHHIHHRGVKLEADVAGAVVEDGTEDALQHHAEAHAVKQALLLEDSLLSQMVRGHGLAPA